jgi:hypothetical protein
MCADEDLVSMLRVVREADEAREPIDSDALASRLGWSDERTANLIAEAREALLIWGVRVGGMLADLELTVQGRRLLRNAGTGNDVARDE